jgi:hypothetical protein
MTDIAESEFPALFAHGTRKDWGMGVLAGERDGKRSYLFESGEERVMGGGAYDMMRKVSPLDKEQQATLARLTALVARRQGRADPSKAAGFSLLEQLEGHHRTCLPKGLCGSAWPRRRPRPGHAAAEPASGGLAAFAQALDAAQRPNNSKPCGRLCREGLRDRSGWPPIN